jgi:hypothetical protein
MLIFQALTLIGMPRRWTGPFASTIRDNVLLNGK